MPNQRPSTTTSTNTSKAETPASSPMQTSSNPISCLVGSIKATAMPLVKGFGQLPPALQAPILVVMLLFSIVPVLWLLFVVPPICLVAAGVYSYRYGYHTFVGHFEMAMREHFEVSEESFKKVHENADMIKSRAAKVQSKVSHQATSAFFLSVYSVILYAMKFKLHSLLNVLKSQGAKAKVNLPKENGAKPKK